MSKAKTVQTAAPKAVKKLIQEFKPPKEERLPDENIPHTLGGLKGAFIGMFGREPTDREIWDHAIRSWRDLNEPRLKDLPVNVTDERIDGVIVEVTYPAVPQGTLTLAAVRTVNGHVEVGSSACVAREKYNPEMGMKYALEDARNKIAEHEAYLLRQKRHEARQ